MQVSKQGPQSTKDQASRPEICELFLVFHPLLQRLGHRCETFLRQLGAAPRLLLLQGSGEAAAKLKGGRPGKHFTRRGCKDGAKPGGSGEAGARLKGFRPGKRCTTRGCRDGTNGSDGAKVRRVGGMNPLRQLQCRLGSSALALLMAGNVVSAHGGDPRAGCAPACHLHQQAIAQLQSKTILPALDA